MQPHRPKPEGYLTSAQLAEILNMPRSAVLRLHRAGKLPGAKIGHRTVRFRLSEVERALGK